METLNLSALYERLRVFARERDWEQFHTPKNISMAIAGEAGELLEIFQWLTPAESEKGNLTADQLKRVEEEISDVLIYTLRLSDRLGIDVAAAVDRKIQENAKTYPVSSAKGNARKHIKKK